MKKEIREEEREEKREKGTKSSETKSSKTKTPKSSKSSKSSLKNVSHLESSKENPVQVSNPATATITGTKNTPLISFRSLLTHYIKADFIPASKEGEKERRRSGISNLKDRGCIMLLG